MKRETTSYLKTVDQIISDMDAKRIGESMHEQAMFFDRYARKINRKSVTRVDPEIAKLGQQVADHLNSIVGIIQQAGRDIGYLRRAGADNTAVDVGIWPYRVYTTAYGRYYEFVPFATARMGGGENVRAEVDLLKEAREKALEEYSKIEDLNIAMHKRFEKRFGKPNK